MKDESRPTTGAGQVKARFMRGTSRSRGDGVEGKARWRQAGLGPVLAGLVFLGRVFPLGIDFGFELAAADQFLKVADDGAAGDTKLAGEGRDVGPLAGFADDFPDAILPAEAVGRAAEQVEGVDAVGAFEGLELADGFTLAAFFKGGLDGAFEGADVHRLGEAVMGATGPLERLRSEERRVGKAGR